MSAVKTTKILKDYEVILKGDYTYYVFYGGRGAGKSDNIGLVITLRVALEKDLRVLCVRELENTIQSSIWQSIVDSIYLLGLQDAFRIMRKEIVCLATGSIIIFSGLNKINARKIKSIKKITLTWIEEATDLDEYTWLTIMPSVMREPNSQMIVSFNPVKETDYVYKNFILNTPPENSYIKKVGYRDNPFFANTPLEKLRLSQMQSMPIEIYRHIWEGEIQKIIKNAIWSDTQINNMMGYLSNYDDFVSVAIACDPATSSKDYSNEFGVIVLGKVSSGHIYILQDFSSNYTPIDFSNKVNELYLEWSNRCENVRVVVEVNQGGDFIKHSLVSINPLMEVVEVRAGIDKVQRVLPIATLCQNGQVFFDEASNSFLELKNQMRLMTYSGFQGAKGQSPDRVDALVWGVFYLSGMKDFDMRESYYASHFFVFNKDFSFLETKDNAIVWLMSQGECAILIYDIVSNNETEKRILITDSIICKNAEIDNALQDYRIGHLFVPNNELASNIVWDFPNVQIYEVTKSSLNDLCEQTYAFIENGKVMLKDKMPIRKYDLDKGELIKLSLFEYSKESKKDFSLLIALNYLVKELFM